MTACDRGLPGTNLAARFVIRKEKICMSRQRLATLILLATLLLSCVPSLGLAQSYTQDFEQTMAKVNNTPPLAGPFDYSLVQQANVLTVYRAGLDVGDFVAHATFTNPSTDAGVNWDYGFQFHTTGNNEDLRIFVVSDGTWNFAVGTDPPDNSVVAPNLNTALGASNSLDLIVEGFQALLGINGQFVASISLPDLLPSGDVYASTGFFGDISVSGRTIGLSDFQVWAIPPEEGAAAPATPTGPPPARPVTLRAGSCDALGSVIETMTDATYPIGDRKGQASAIVAETSFTRVPRFLDDILAGTFAIEVAASHDAPDTTIACGNVGGILDEIGGFVIGLQEENGSGYNGVAYLAGEDELGRTNISVFLVPTSSAQASAETPVAPVGTPVAPAATPVVTEVIEIAPAGTPQPAATPGAG
jgi:hypothetical protein